ncbi:MAG: GNAT family N-acetyltransferase [Clostridia bacterium]|nr:GNAT family N-acetyltransferase [Clostridia bacterium]
MNNNNVENNNEVLNINIEDIEIKYLNKVTDKSFKFQILNLLILSDKEFIPALSSRESTTQTNLSGNSQNENTNKNVIPYNYYKNILNQSMLVATFENYIIGFMSFKKNYTCEHISEEFLPNLYVSTVIVNSNYRGKGITKLFYKKLNELFFDHHIFTRTWSTNAGHLKILNSLGFKNTVCLKNDRGENIDTVYYMWNANKKL